MIRHIRYVAETAAPMAQLIAAVATSSRMLVLADTSLSRYNGREPFMVEILFLDLV
jgi:hypothetical protein